MKASHLLAAASLAGLVLVASGCTERVVRERTVVEPAPIVAEVIAPQAPPPVMVEEVVERPGYVWIRGYWHWTGSRYVWRKGHWDRVRPGYHHVAAHYVRQADGWHFRAGIWIQD